MSQGTRHLLIETASGLVRRQGYSAFSYADLADAVGIRKPSIHHHFPGKEDLGEALVAAYTEAFSERLDLIRANEPDAIARLRRYAELYREGLTKGQGCLCGVLASEIAVLPEKVQVGVRRFFSLHLLWLEETLAEGVDAGGLRQNIHPRREARIVLSALQGAMFVALAMQDVTTFDDAVDGLLTGMKAKNDGEQ